MRNQILLYIKTFANIKRHFQRTAAAAAHIWGNEGIFEIPSGLRRGEAAFPYFADGFHELVLFHIVTDFKPLHLQQQQPASTSSSKSSSTSSSAAASINLLELLKRNSLESGSLQPLAVVVGVEDQARRTQMFNFYGKAARIAWLDVYSLPIYATWGKNKIFGWVKETVGGSGRRRSVNRAESYPSEVSGNFHQCTDHRWKQWPYNSTTWLCQKYSESIISI